MMRRITLFSTTVGVFLLSVVLSSSADAQSYCPAQSSGYSQAYAPSQSFSTYPTYSFQSYRPSGNIYGTAFSSGQVSSSCGSFQQSHYYNSPVMTGQPIVYRSGPLPRPAAVRAIPSQVSNFVYRSAPSTYYLPASPYCYGSS